MPSYSLFRSDKVKTYSDMKIRFNHNYRLRDVAHASAELKDLNEELIPLNYTDYRTAFEERIKSLPYYKDHEIRKNAVLGYEVLLKVVGDQPVDMEAWKKASIDWLHDTYDVAGDGKSNILGAVFHADEAGPAHIHAFVVPVDERGRLNAARFTNGSAQMSALQTSYADRLKDLGVERGSKAVDLQYEKVRNLYQKVQKSLDQIPEARENESARHFRERLGAYVDRLVTSAHRQANDIVTKARQDMNEERALLKEDLTMEIERNRNQVTSIRKEETRAKETCKNLQIEIEGYTQTRDALIAQIMEQQRQTEEYEEVVKKAKEMEQYRKGLEELRKMDPYAAARVQAQLQDMIKRGEESPKAKEKEKEIDRDKRSR